MFKKNRLRQPKPLHLCELNSNRSRTGCSNSVQIKGVPYLVYKWVTKEKKKKVDSTNYKSGQNKGTNAVSYVKLLKKNDP